MKQPSENCIKFQRNIDELIICAEENCLTVVCGWSITISKDIALEYVRTYNKHFCCNAGFFEHEGNVTFTHSMCKLTLSKAEALATVNLIKATYQ